MASQNRRWSRSVARILVNRSAALCAHQSAILAFEQKLREAFQEQNLGGV